jgi:hypothetical protein
VNDRPSPLARLSQQIMRLLGQWQVLEQQYTVQPGESLQVAQPDPFRLALHIGALSGTSSIAGSVVVSTLPGVSSTVGTVLADHPVGKGIVYPLWGELLAQPWYVWVPTTSQVTITVTTVRAQQ